MIYYVEADTQEEIARLLRGRGRTLVTAPPRTGKTIELIRYAEERYPNGRFAVVAKDGKHIVDTHWLIYNGLTWVDAVTKKLLNEKLKGEDPVAPLVVTPQWIHDCMINKSTPIFVDDWDLLSEEAQRKIYKHRLFIAAVRSSEESIDASSEEDQNG